MKQRTLQRCNVIAVVLLVFVLAMPGAAAPRCRYWPVRGRQYCWCYGAWGWHTAPALFCRAGRR